MRGRAGGAGGAQLPERCVIKSKAAQAGNIELNVKVRLKSEDTSFVNGLAATPGVSSAVLVSYNGDYMG